MKTLFWPVVALIATGYPANADDPDDAIAVIRTSSGWLAEVPTGSFSMSVPLEAGSPHRVKLRIVREGALRIEWDMPSAPSSAIADDGTFDIELFWEGDGISGIYGLRQTGRVRGGLRRVDGRIQIRIDSYRFVSSHGSLLLSSERSERPAEVRLAL